MTFTFQITRGGGVALGALLDRPLTHWLQVSFFLISGACLHLYRALGSALSLLVELYRFSPICAIVLSATKPDYRRLRKGDKCNSNTIRNTSRIILTAKPPARRHSSLSVRTIRWITGNPACMYTPQYPGIRTRQWNTNYRFVPRYQILRSMVCVCTRYILVGSIPWCYILYHQDRRWV